MLIWIAIMVLAIFLDQLTKYLTILFLKPIPTFPIIEDVIHLTYVENTGAAFGMMKDARWLFMSVSSIAIIALLIYLFKKKTHHKLENLSIAFIIGGGIGNMIDRFFLGYVVDMIDFRLINFAVFNVADSFVCVGAGLLMLYIILSTVKEYKEEKARKLALLEEETADDEEVCDKTEDAGAWENEMVKNEIPKAISDEADEVSKSCTEDEDHV